MGGKRKRGGRLRKAVRERGNTVPAASCGARSGKGKGGKSKGKGREDHEAFYLTPSSAFGIS